MKDPQSQPDKFEIQVDLNGKAQTLTVSPDETSDGAAYFKCKISGKDITQVREEPGGEWEQIWGDLDAEAIQQIGKAIKKHHKL